jgi:hypothetical protein
MAASVVVLSLPCAALAQVGDGGPPPPSAPAPPATGNYGADIAYTGAPGDIAARETTLEARIHEASANGAINRYQAHYDFDQLALIRKFESDRAQRDNGLNAVDRADLYKRLDDLDAKINGQRKFVGP